ncbi:heme/hemin ABC transporter substrate-binding protein [Streptacidiphilus cavernicola]|uniref:Hemin ABC transporter substrate-binding protein n=1 Tax=Streptacidiphilus cavernicola TaxID=3342716 RepID=A0ABV6VXC7_9ACTN
MQRAGVPQTVRGRWAAVLLALPLALGLTACGGAAGPGVAGTAAPAAAGATAAPADAVLPLTGTAAPRLPVTVRSADGRQVTVTAVRRIVPLSGSLAELVFSLGLGADVVGRDVSTTFPQAAKLPLVSHDHTIPAEGVLSLHPDLVLSDSSTGTSNADTLAKIRAAGVPVVTFADPQRLADIDPRIEAVAAALGVLEAGARLAQRTDRQLAAVQAAVKPPADGRRPRVAFLYVRGSASVYLIGGQGSGAESLIAAAGGEDAGTAGGLKAPFTPITSEALAQAAPDAILVMTRGLASVGGVDGLLKLPGVAQTPAGRDRRVVSVEDGELLSYGPRTPAVLRSIVDQLYGAAAAK